MSNYSGKGTEFEYEICQFFSIQGYFTRRSIPIKTIESHDVTDVDVFGIKFTYPFEKHTLLCDCKNKARSKPYERIFWAKGLGTFVNTNCEYVALPKVSNEIIDFAQKSKVRIISLDEVKRVKGEESGYSDYSFYNTFNVSLDVKSKEFKEMDNLITILKGQYLSSDPYTGLNRALVILNKMANNLVVNKCSMVIFAEAMSVVAYSLLDICRDVFGMSFADKERYISDRLTYGESDPNYINGLIENITEYANRIIIESIPKPYAQTNTIQAISIPVPHYAKNCIGLIERAYKNPENYIDVLNNIDFILHEFVLKDKVFDIRKFTEYNKGFMIEEKLKACKNVMHFACTASGLHLDNIWKQEIGFIPLVNKL